MLIDTVRSVLAGIDWATSDAIDARHALEQFRFSYARESGDWAIYGGRAPAWARAEPADSRSDRATFYRNAEIYRIAMVAALLGDTAQARAVVDSLPERAVIRRAQVSALLAKARGDTANWIAGLSAAAKADEMVVHFGSAERVSGARAARRRAAGTSAGRRRRSPPTRKGWS